MPYCVNCGVEYLEKPPMCKRCFLDPAILEANIDRHLEKYGVHGNMVGDIDFTYPGERTSLAFSLMILIIISAILGTVSLGMFSVLVAAALLNLKITSIRNRGSMIELTGENFPDLFRMVKLICYRLKAPLLPVYIRQDQDYNAHTQGFLGNAWVVVNSSLIDDFTPGELAFIIGHEFAHIKRRHTTWLTLMSPASGNISSQLLGSLIRTIFNLWSLKCEHTADRGGLIAVRSMEDAAGALIKVAAGQKLSSQVDWRQALKEHDKRDGFLMKAAELLGTHPFPINRIKEIYMFSESRKYKAGGL